MLVLLSAEAPSEPARAPRQEGDWDPAMGQDAFVNLERWEWRLLSASRGNSYIVSILSYARRFWGHCSPVSAPRKWGSCEQIYLHNTAWLIQRAGYFEHCGCFSGPFWSLGQTFQEQLYRHHFERNRWILHPSQKGLLHTICGQGLNSTTAFESEKWGGRGEEW